MYYTNMCIYIYIYSHTNTHTDLRNVFANRGVVEIEGVAGMPFSIPLFKFKLHEMSSDGGEEHLAWLSTDRIVELEDPIIPRPTISHSQTLVS